MVMTTTTTKGRIRKEAQVTERKAKGEGDQILRHGMRRKTS